MTRVPRPWQIRLGLAYLRGAVAFDAVIAVLAWAAPRLWFGFFHGTLAQDEGVALLRRAAGQWIAFALAQLLALALWRRRPAWFAIAAGIRFSDLFTDLSYLVAARPMLLRGVIALAPLPLLNLAGVVLLVRCHALAARRAVIPPG